MRTESITLKEAYIIENLRKKGVTNEQLIQIENQNIDSWKEVIETDDFDMLKALATNNKERYLAIIKTGYQVKFLTINGLINLIQLKFNKEKDLDFKVHENGISDLKLDENSLLEVKQFLSQNWKVIEDGEFIEVRSVNS